MKVKFIAEIGSNHNQDLRRALALIDKAKSIGCWAVKFQLFQAEKLYAPEFKDQIKKMKGWELPLKFVPLIKRFCKKKDIKFICTPFDLGAVEYLSSFVDYFKIGSYELLWKDLIETVIKTGKPWIVSTGMENFHPTSFVENVDWANAAGQMMGNPPYAILHCNSNYPAKPENCNLERIFRLKNYFRHQKTRKDLIIGWSDHTCEPGIIHKAIELGAEIIEFHFDHEDGQGYESEFGHCWKPSKILETIINIKTGELATISVDSDETEARKWRTDPEDGLRPLKKYREELLPKKVEKSNPCIPGTGNFAGIW